MLIELRSRGELESRELALISHRGGKGFGPENTLQSLQGALDYGVEMVATLLPVSLAVRSMLVDAAHEAHLKVITWTVNSTEILRDMFIAGVDGVITDSYPELDSFLRSGVAYSGTQMITARNGAGNRR
jgi:glycerophosphoryl diester phosphodiesterase